MADTPARLLDVQRIFETLARHGVAYLVIGGVAAQVHGHRRTTKDLDVVPAPGAENAELLGAALAELGATVADPAGAPELDAADPERLGLAAVVPPLITDHGEIHIVNEPKGADEWSRMRERALVVELDGVEVAIVGLDDLIRMKLASGRPADLDDVAILTAIERESS